VPKGIRKTQPLSAREGAEVGAAAAAAAGGENTIANWKKDTAQQLLTNTYDLCMTASRVVTKNDEVLRDRQKECEIGRKTVVETMRKRLLETADFRKALEKELRETDFAITGISEGLTETERQCDIHNVPLLAIKQGAAVPKQKLYDESGKKKTEAQLAKEDVLNGISPHVRALQEQYKRKKTVLAQMTAIRQQLHEDLRFKVQAVSIDTQCSKLLTRPQSAHLGTKPAPPRDSAKPPFRRKVQRDNREGAGFNQTWGPGSNGW